MKTADEILRANKCGDIFKRGDKDSIVSEYREMARVFHPDVCTHPKTNEIMSKLNQFYEVALNLVETGGWEASNLFEVRDICGKRYFTSYLKSYTFELGEIYIADLSITYLLDEKHERYFNNAIEQIKALRYANKEMEKEISRYMPSIRYAFKTNTGKYCLILSKTPDAFMLTDVLDYYKGQIPERHVAWIVSRLNNICCYYDYLGIAHNGLSLDNCLISPQFHTILPLGGWWYARKLNDTMIGVPRVIYDIMPVKAKSEKISSAVTDLESSKLIGRQLLGKDGLNSSPQAFREFLNSGSLSDARLEFSRWNKTLDSSYGKRQFIKMEVGKQEIYNI